MHPEYLLRRIVKFDNESRPSFDFRLGRFSPNAPESDPSKRAIAGERGQYCFLMRNLWSGHLSPRQEGHLLNELNELWPDIYFQFPRHRTQPNIGGRAGLESSHVQGVGRPFLP